MRRSVELCDLCFSEYVTALADGRYTTDEEKTFCACEEHLEQCQGFGFAVVKFDHPGNCEPG